MSNIIRPKVSNAIKEITSMDGSGKSKAQIDTKKEYDELKNYLSGNYEELNSTERNRIKELLNKAKEYLHITDKHDQDSKVGWAKLHKIANNCFKFCIACPPIIFLI